MRFDHNTYEFQSTSNSFLKDSVMSEHLRSTSKASSSRPYMTYVSDMSIVFEGIVGP